MVIFVLLLDVWIAKLKREKESGRRKMSTKIHCDVCDRVIDPDHEQYRNVNVWHGPFGMRFREETICSDCWKELQEKKKKVGQ